MLVATRLDGTDGGTSIITLLRMTLDGTQSPYTQVGTRDMVVSALLKPTVWAKLPSIKEATTIKFVSGKCYEGHCRGT